MMNQKFIDDQIEVQKELHAQVKKLQAEVDRLKADEVRLDWLADKNQNIGNVMLPTVCVEQNLHSLRGAIDMAMQLEQSND